MVRLPFSRSGLRPGPVLMLAGAVLWILLLTSAEALAQDEDQPPPEGRRRWGISGDFDWSISNAEDSSLNLTYYANDVTRLLRLSLLFDFRISDRALVYVNVTSENAADPHLYGAFVRLAPWGGDRLWLQAGKIPPAFGAFPERWYAVANPLIGYPLMYHHRTSLRSDQLPLNASDLLRQRGRGRSPQLGGAGSNISRPGMPMIALFRWDTGVVAFGREGSFQYLVGVTNGTFSNPRVQDANDGKQFLARVRYRYEPALQIGVSAARGPYLDDDVAAGLRGADLNGFHQTVAGADLHFARGHLVVDAEAAWSRWKTPNIDAALDARSGFLESRYRLRPGLYVAGRLDHMSFSEIQGQSWDAPLTRVELGAGYSWERNVVLKLSVQRNRFEGAPELDEDIVALQIAVHF